MRRPLTVLVVSAVAVLTVLPMAPAGAAPKDKGKRQATKAVAETAPRDAACRYHDPEARSHLLTADEARRPSWPQQRLAYEQAHRFTTGQGVVVAVVDSGVDAGQEHLKGRVLRGLDVTSGKVQPGGDRDCVAHGTLVSGILAGSRVPGRAFVGVAPGAKILPVRESWAIDSNAHAYKGSVGNLLRAMQVAFTSGAKVVNISVTVPQSQLSPAEQGAFAKVAQLASDRDVVVVAASGNLADQVRAIDPNGPTYPARLAQWFPNFVAVSAVTSDGAVDKDAVTGPFVSLTAPGRDMPCPMDRGGLVPCFGTSFAAPFVSGTAALVRSRFPKLSAEMVVRRLEETAVHPAAELPDPQVGYGVVDPVAAVTSTLPAARSPRPGPASAAVLSPPPSRRGVRVLSAVVVGVAGGGTALVVAGLFVVRHGRRRRWRPGRHDVPGSSGGASQARGSELGAAC